MKPFVPFALIIVSMCLFCAGCLHQTTTESNNGNIAPSQTFSPFMVPGTEGTLQITLSGFSSEYPAYVDTVNVGVVSAGKPVSLKLLEGNYTVSVCCGKLCEQENVTIRFGKQRIVDFTERLKNEWEVSEPAVRITDYYLSGDTITVEGEFINPTPKALNMSADISCGYSYIDAKSNLRVVTSVQGHMSSLVQACDRTTRQLNLNLAGGSRYLYHQPTITLISFQ